MRLPTPVRDNLFFLLAETSSQIGNLQVAIETASKSLMQQISARRGYAYNLKMRIHDGCMNEVRNKKQIGQSNTYSLRAAEAIASELERITELVHDCTGQMSGTKRARIFQPLAEQRIMDELVEGIQLTRVDLDQGDTKSALRITATARNVISHCESFVQKQSRDLRKRKRPKDVVACLFVAQRINEMGNALMNISEAMISARLGHPLNMDRFRFLESAFEDLGIDGAEVQTIAETKSGAGVSGIGNGDQDGYIAIFKDGEKKKLKEERASVESWHEIFPGLAPQILSYRKRGASAALLIEHLPGQTFEQILLNGSDELLAKTSKHLATTLNAVWNETKRSKKVPAHQMSQLRKRLDSVREIHAELGTSRGRIGDQPTRSLDELIETAEKLENKISPPFSVYIHGDFNLDNIIYDPSEKRINFIDLHRSCYADYVQDVSVFMISNYRLQALDARTRYRIAQTAIEFHQMAADFAERNEDQTFQLRLALGLARSFITSTRFILDKSLAKAMYLRGHYLLERIVEQNKKTAGEFSLPVKELFR